MSEDPRSWYEDMRWKAEKYEELEAEYNKLRARVKELEAGITNCLAATDYEGCGEHKPCHLINALKEQTE